MAMTWAINPAEFAGALFGSSSEDFSTWAAIGGSSMAV